MKTPQILKRNRFSMYLLFFKSCITATPEYKYTSNFTPASCCKVLIESISWSHITNK